MSIDNHCVEHNYTGSVCGKCAVKGATCVICEVEATKYFFGKTLCAHHYELSAH